MTMPSSFTYPEETPMKIRLYTPSDREFLLSLVSRLSIGIAVWRSREAMEAVMRQFIIESIEQHPTRTVVFVAVNQPGQQLGFASVSRSKNFTGEAQAYLGEMAVSEEAEGHGFGSALLRACEEWARNQGYTLLVLETGTANKHARNFYEHCGFQEESIKLVKQL